MLEGLMQHDHPLTLQLVLERMRGMNGDARGRHVHGRRDDARRPTPRSASASTGCAAGCRSSAWATATAWRRSRGTPRPTSRPTSRCRAWGPCCTP